MISKIFIAFFIFLAAKSCLGQDKEFIDRVLDSEYCKNCFFLVINVKSEAFSGRAIVENGKLIKYLKKTLDLDQVQTERLIRKLVEDKQSLILENVILDGNFLNIIGSTNHEFRIVKKQRKVDEIFAKGCVNAIKYYFLDEISDLESDENVEIERCHAFILKQKKDLFLRRTSIGVSEVSYLIDTLFGWQIPIMIDDVSGLPVIYQGVISQKAMKNEKR